MRKRLTAKGTRTEEDIQPTVLLQHYMQQIEPTDMLPKNDLHPVKMGLFGEVGGIMATAKKLHREKEAYGGYTRAAEDEFGDAFWYFTTLCQRLGIGVDAVVSAAIQGDGYENTIAASNLTGRPISQIFSVADLPPLDQALIQLGEAATALLAAQSLNEHVQQQLRIFATCYLQSIQAARLDFSHIIQQNIKKTRGRFLEPEITSLPTFDSGFGEDERLPRKFRITITQRSSGQCYMQWNGVFIGDPLTDNILDPDGYRFHDVFHFAHAAILHWSPTFRALIKHKRKSAPKIDEAQDGGRAIVIEEGLTAWIFSRAKELDFFRKQKRLSFDLLKTVQDFVRGYEVEECPLWLWEKAILKGYEVFNQVRDNNGGIITSNRDQRTIKYTQLPGS